jgi:hypothetical protein
MKKRMRESEVSELVARTLERTFDCRAVRELTVGDCKFDAVGFSSREKCFYVVETKTGSKPSDIGHAFGQILAYEAVISQDGRSFVRNFYNKLNTKERQYLDFEDLSSITSKKVNVRFFVALTEAACRNTELLRYLKNTESNVGIFRIRKDGRLRDHLKVPGGGEDSKICESNPVQIDIARKYKRKDFLIAIRDRMLVKYPTLTPSLRTAIVQLRLGKTGFHLEAGMYVKKEELRLSMDIEPKNTSEKNEFFRFAHRKIEKLKREIDGLQSQENWVHGKYGRVILVLDKALLTDELVERSVGVLSALYDMLNTPIHEFQSSTS